DTHAGQDRDVDLRVAEEPEEVLPEYRRAAFMIDHLIVDDQTRRNEEARAAYAIEKQQDSARQKDREGEQREDRRRKPGPAGERQAHQGHSLDAQVQERDDEIERPHQRGGTEEGDT